MFWRVLPDQPQKTPLKRGFLFLAAALCDSGVIFAGETLTYCSYVRAFAVKNALLSLRSRRQKRFWFRLSTKEKGKPRICGAFFWLQLPETSKVTP
jgi:hypothetical protein